MAVVDLDGEAAPRLYPRSRAGIAAGLVVHQFTRWLREFPARGLGQGFVVLFALIRIAGKYRVSFGGDHWRAGDDGVGRGA